MLAGRNDARAFGESFPGNSDGRSCLRSYRITWRAAPRELRCAREEILLFRLNLNPREARLKELEDLLSTDERERAQRFHFSRDRRRYLAGRGQLREILGNLTGVDPSALTFSYNASGKPDLHTSEWHFNLAHADALALVSVTRTGPTGVDLERIRPLSEAAWIVENLFSKSDREWWNSLPAAERTHSFFRLWTLKEAYVKATGEGLSGSVNRIETDTLAPMSGEMATVSDDLGVNWNWRFRPFDPDPGCVASVVVQDPKRRINRCRFWEWTESR